MKFTKNIFYLAVIFSSFVLPHAFCYAESSTIKADEAVTAFPTSAYFDNKKNQWVIPIHGWIYEAETDSLWRNTFIDSLADYLELSNDDTKQPLFKARAQQFLVDNEGSKQLSAWVIDQQTVLNSSDANGHFYGKVFFTTPKNYTPNQWISFRITSSSKFNNREFFGEAQLVPEEGISVISDIDDTIKLSNVLDKKKLLRNTFLENYQAIPQMADAYNLWQKQSIAFHYVSASPWQLYPFLRKFLEESGFPKGSFHLKLVRLKDETLLDLFSEAKQYKIPVIEEILQRFPKRQFILVGDSGEQDPEIYADIAKRFPQQILHIFIRKVPEDSSTPERFTKIFQDLPKNSWTVFSMASELKQIHFDNLTHQEK